MSDDPVATRVSVIADGDEFNLHFQEYWVKRRARDEAKAIRYEGVEAAAPGPGVLESIEAADLVVLCPSNPIASLLPILSVPGIGKAVAHRRDAAVGISPIVGGAPLAGMADRLMPVAGYAVTALGAAECYRGLLAGWVVDHADRELASRIERELGVRVAVTDTVMADDAKAENVARAALDLMR
jgi:LPPG:FO 2-phospho-L-lactate transferase